MNQGNIKTDLFFKKNSQFDNFEAKNIRLYSPSNFQNGGESENLIPLLKLK